MNNPGWLASLTVLAACSADPFGCGEQAYCKVESGQYIALLPEGWRSAGPLTTFVHFHGYGGTAREMADKASFTEPLRATGALAIYPEGLDRAWSNVGSPHQERDEQAFVAQVLDDALERFPVDPDRVVMSGFSQGASVAWDVACYQPDRVTAFAPVSGAFWEPLPATCSPAGRRLRHEHGTADGTFPLEGRPIAGTRQGDVRESVARLVAAQRCPATPTVVEEGGRTCEVWSDCADGGELVLCLHDGGHLVTEGWAERAWAFLDQNWK